MKLLAIALPALFLASAAFAQGGTPAPTPSEQTEAGEGRGTAQTGAETEAAAEDPGERRICRRIGSTGTNRSDRVCMTARQWREYNNQ